MGRKCIKCNEECATCIGNQELECSSCAPGYYFTLMNTNPYNPYTGKCESCSKDNSNCLLCIENCNDDDNFNCEPTPICTKCVDGFYIDNNNVCKPCDKSCGSCIGPTIYDCVTCAEGLMRYEDTCVGCSDKCLTCDITPTNCTSCRAGQYVKDGTCNSCNLDICAECEGNPDHCTKCPSGKYLYEHKCYSSCTDAGAGIGLNQSTNECYKCPAIGNCNEYDISCKCAKCEEGYTQYTDPLTNVHICSQCKPDNCKVCTGIETNDCTECFYGFYLYVNSEANTKECKQCELPCVACSGPDGKTCNECDIGFDLNGSICEVAYDGCKLGEHCDKNNTDGTEYVNYTTTLPNYTSIETETSGGALSVVNGGFSAQKCNFTSCTSSKGGGGAIYIYNNIPNTESTYKIHFRNLTFEDCKANYGAAAYIYSPSEVSPITIESCSFNDNKLLENSNGKLKGGSALYIVARKCEIKGCSFNKNKGKGGAVRITDDFENNLPDGLKILHSYNTLHASISISNCNFEIDESSDCSLFYSNGMKLSKVVVNDCTFSGVLAKGSHYIDGKSIKDVAPNLFIKACPFSSNANQAMNNKFIKNDSLYISQNTFTKTLESPTKSVPLTTIIPYCNRSSCCNKEIKAF